MPLLLWLCQLKRLLVSPTPKQGLGVPPEADVKVVGNVWGEAALMEKLGGIELRDGRGAEILRLSVGSDEVMGDLLELLGHKGRPWLWHLEQWHEGLTPGMDAHFYVVRLEGRFVGNVTVFRNGGFGNIAHVYTVRESRRLGVAKALLEAAVADFAQDSGEVLVLHAKLDGFEWRLYESVGFSGIWPEGQSGGMVRFFGGRGWSDVFKCQTLEICPLEWRHFVGTQILFGSPGAELIRSIHLPCIGRRFIEEEFIRLKKWQGKNADCNAWVIEGQGACVLGFATVREHPMWGRFGRSKVLDLFFHPTGSQMAGALLEAVLAETCGSLECYCDSAGEEKIALLREAGFETNRIDSVFRCGSELRDLVVCRN